MTTATKEQTCAERIAEQMNDREEQLRQMVEQVEESEYYGDEEAIYELALSVETVKLTTVCLSWGGPADYLEITHSGGQVSRVIYRFSDWFDTATREIEEGSYLWNYALMIIETQGEGE